MYTPALRAFQESLAQFHPQTAHLLARIEEEFGALAASCAADVIVLLQARVDICGSEAAGFLTEDDLESLPYFELMRDNLPGLERIVDLLEYFALECEMFAATTRN